jgi:uncharacterized membrane protein/protein-disulfide isomerase
MRQHFHYSRLFCQVVGFALPMTYNSFVSASAFSRLNLVLSMAGLYIAGMLSLSHLLNIQLPCGIGTGCDLITQDPRSQLLGVPFAYYGLLGYLVICVISIVRLLAPSLMSSFLHGAGYVLSFIGLGVSFALTTYSVTSFHAICTWCIASAVTMSLLFVSHAWQSLQEARPGRSLRALDGSLLVVLLAVLGVSLTQSALSLKVRARTFDVTKADLKKKEITSEVLTQGHFRGPDNAPVLIVMFGDLTCPVCRAGYLHLTDLMRKRRDFSLVFRHLPLRIHPTALPAAVVSEMAAERGRFWEFADSCYRDYLYEVDDFIRAAGKLGLDAAEVRRRLADRSDPARELVDDDLELAHRMGLHSTPSVFALCDGFDIEPIAYSGAEDMIEVFLKARAQQHAGTH